MSVSGPKGQPFYTSAAFAILIATVAVVLFFSGAILLLYLSHLPESAIAAATGVLVSIAGPLIAVLVLLIRQQFNVDVAIHTQQLVDGHLQQHMGNDNPPATPSVTTG